MDRAPDAELLQSYLDDELSADEVRQLEERLCAEPALADMLLALSRREAMLIEWSSATSAIRTIKDVDRKKVPSAQKSGPRMLPAWRVAAGIAVLLAVAGALLVMKSPETNRPAEIGRIVSAENGVSVRRGSNVLTLASGSGLCAGDRIETGKGGKAEVAYLSDATTLKFGAETVATLDSEAAPSTPGKAVSVSRGSLSADVARQPSGKPMLIHTPQALCTVVGTELRVSVDGDGTRLDVTKGTVQFQRLADAAEVAVATGNFAVADAPERAAPRKLVALPCGRRYIAAPDGSPHGNGTLERPWDLASALGAELKPGDTLALKAGVYFQALPDVLPGGESWDQPVTVTALDPDNRPVLRPDQGDYVLHLHQAPDAGGVHHVVVHNIILDAAHVTDSAVLIESPAHHIRLIDCEIRNSPHSGVVTFGELAEGNEFIRLDVHDNGTTDLNHGIDLGSTGNRIEGSKIHRNAGWGVHVYAEKFQISGNAVIANAIWDNARAGQRGPGIGLYSGVGHRAVDNVIWGNACGIQLAEGASNAGIYHNTVVMNRGHGIEVEVNSGGGNAIVNNIVSRNAKEGIALDIAAGARVTSNLCFQNGTAVNSAEPAHKEVLDVQGSGTISENLLFRDPLFANAERADFHVLPQSPASGAAAPLDDPDAAWDADGKRRSTQRRAIGAYEPNE